MTQDFTVDELTAAFARLHGLLLSEESATGAVHQLARVARQTVGSAAGAGVSLLDDRGKRVSTGATDALVELADALQYELGEGPCLSAWATLEHQRIDDTTQDPRWPRWERAAADGGILSVLSTPLVHRGHCLGALKVYAAESDAFGDADERLLGLLADAAATLLGAVRTKDAPQRLSAALKAALRDRETIGLAAGMLMQRDGLDQDAARRALLDTARSQGRPVAQVAAGVVRRGLRPEQ